VKTFDRKDFDGAVAFVNAIAAAANRLDHHPDIGWLGTRSRFAPGRTTSARSPNAISAWRTQSTTSPLVRLEPKGTGEEP